MISYSRWCESFGTFSRYRIAAAAAAAPWRSTMDGKGWFWVMQIGFISLDRVPTEQAQVSGESGVKCAPQWWSVSIKVFQSFLFRIIFWWKTFNLRLGRVNSRPNAPLLGAWNDFMMYNSTRRLAVGNGSRIEIGSSLIPFVHIPCLPGFKRFDCEIEPPADDGWWLVAAGPGCGGSGKSNLQISGNAMKSMRF